ncbi:hypothetical protein RRG08_040953 [Elysia crispata]|uniref:Uncharacterized protein n=1 Tax=Elysia crispata TaxID=231223 RepID=A0AAE1E242_9GAST|nr:hypothetical protein RRG08_040953 [Elysia crispata]
MRGSDWDRVVDQNKNYNGYSGFSRMSRGCLYDYDSFGDIGKLCFNFHDATIQPPSEPRFSPMKSAFNTWISSSQTNHLTKLRKAKSHPRVSYSPIRNRFSTRYLPARCHLDTSLEPYLAEQLTPEMDASFAWPQSQTGEPWDAPSARVVSPTNPRRRSPTKSKDPAEGKVRSEASRELQAKQGAKQSYSAVRSKSHSAQCSRLQLTDDFWWDKGKTSRRMPYLLETGDSRQVGSNTLRRYCGRVSADHDERGKPLTAQKLNDIRISEKDKTASSCKTPDARTVEIKRQLLAAREKFQQEYAGFNLVQAKVRKQSFEREVKKQSYEREAKKQSFEREAKKQPFEREVKNQSFGREAKKQPFEREVKKQPFEREAKKQPFEREVKKQPFEREVKKQPFEREVKKQFFEREVKKQSFEREVKKQSFEREVKKQPFEREVKKQFFERVVKKQSFEREVKKQPFEREVKKQSFEREAKNQFIEREVKKKHVVPYEPLCRSHNCKAAIKGESFSSASPMLNNTFNGNGSQPTCNSVAFTRTVANNAYTPSPFDNDANYVNQSPRCLQSSPYARIRELHEPDWPRTEGGTAQPATSMQSLENHQCATTFTRSKEKRCKSALSTTIAIPKARLMISKTVRRRKMGRRNNQPQDFCSNAVDSPALLVSRTTVSRAAGAAKSDRPQSAANMNTTKTKSSLTVAVSRTLKTKRRRVGASNHKSADSLQREGSSLGESAKGKKSLDDCESLVRLHTGSHEKAHSVNKGNCRQIQDAKKDELRHWPLGENRGDLGAHKTEHLISTPLKKLEEARKKLHALLAAGSHSPSPATIPNLLIATDNLGPKPLEDNGQGGLFPPHQNPDRFLPVENPSVRTDAEDRDQPEAEYLSNKVSHGLEEKRSGVKERYPSLPATSAESIVLAAPKTSKSTPQLEMFPNVKPHRATIHQPPSLRLKPESALLKVTTHVNPKPDTLKLKTSNGASRVEYHAVSKAEPLDSKGSQRACQGDNKSLAADPAAGDGEHSALNGVKSSRIDTTKIAHLPPTGATASNKKRKLKRKKPKSSREKGATGQAKRREGSNKPQPKTYHQLGLAPLVRSPSSENTFHFAVDLGNMQGANKTPKHRRGRKLKKNRRKLC